MRGEILADLGDFDRALVDHDRAIALAPTARAYINRGSLHEQRGDLDRALLDYTAAALSEPDYAFAHYHLGSIHAMRGETDKALEEFDLTIRFDPNVAGAYWGRGNMHERKRAFDNAIADYTAMIRLDESDPHGYFGRGNAHCSRGDVDAAIADYTELLRLMPRNRDYGAMADAGETIRLDPTDRVVDITRGDRHYSQQDFERTLKDDWFVVTIGKRLPGVYASLGGAYLVKGEIDHAIASYTEAIRLAPEAGLLLRLRANAYRIKGDDVRALVDFKKAKQLDATEQRLSRAT